MCKWNGMNWVTQVKRLALYLRDGMCCVYCGDTIENGAVLSLDHIIPRSKGGSNHERNLITACKRCNTRRHDRNISAWIDIAAEYSEIPAHEIARDIRRKRNRKLKKYIAESKNIIERRGSVAKALSEITIN